MTHLIWNKPNGSCCTTIFTDDFEAQAATLGKTVDELRMETIEKIQASRPDLVGITPIHVDDADIDDPLSFGREVWGHGAKLNMSKARAIKTNQIRPERNERLVALDIDYMRADEAGDTAEKERVAVVKQELRDLPATIQPDLDKIDQPEELEAYEPTWPMPLV
jgi:hypothetical protein